MKIGLSWSCTELKSAPISIPKSFRRHVFGPDSFPSFPAKRSFGLGWDRLGTGIGFAFKAALGSSLGTSFFLIFHVTGCRCLADFCLRPSAKDQIITWVVVLLVVVVVHHLVHFLFKRNLSENKSHLLRIKPGSFSSPAMHFIHWATEP